MQAVAAIDQGTTSTRAFVLVPDPAAPGGLRFTRVFSREHAQSYPRQGWVEHDARELAGNVADALAAALDFADAQGLELVAAGLDNQGETVVAWDADSKDPVYPAIVWQDARTAAELEKLRAGGLEALTRERAGLPLDPYFGASKLRWILDNAPGARALAERGRLRLGSSDAYFLDALAGRFATDVATASRTSLMNLRTLDWDPDLLAAFGVPRQALPDILPTTGDFGTLRARGRGLACRAAIVDQQAALFGHGCLAPGSMKITFGTGAFALANAGTAPPAPDPALGVLPTVAWKLGHAPAVYAVDGGVYNAGSAVNWLLGLGLAGDTGELDRLAPPWAAEAGVFFVPALSGLACPHWDRRAAALWIGMTLDTDRATLQKAVLEGVALRTAQLAGALARAVPAGADGVPLGVDGGLTNNPYFCRFLAAVLGRPIRVPEHNETTALGCALLAALGSGLVEDAAALPSEGTSGRLIPPSPEDAQRAADLPRRFGLAVQRAGNWRDA